MPILEDDIVDTIVCVLPHILIIVSGKYFVETFDQQYNKTLPKFSLYRMLWKQCMQSGLSLPFPLII